MKKMFLIISALLISVNVFAIPATPLSSAISKGLQQSNHNGQSPAMIYGGKDISRSIIM